VLMYICFTYVLNICDLLLFCRISVPISKHCCITRFLFHLQPPLDQVPVINSKPTVIISILLAWKYIKISLLQFARLNAPIVFK
jgi:hypothetical protein